MLALSATTDEPIVIIGAGPTGLGAAWHLDRQKPQGGRARYVMLEQSGHAGGTAASVTTAEGFTFDLGNHVVYPHAAYHAFADMLEAVVPRWHESPPVRGILKGDTLIPYPVQHNLHRLPLRERADAIVGLVGARLARRLDWRQGQPADNDETMADNLRRRFGAGLTRGVMGAINRKMWAHDLSELGSYWAQQRSGSRIANVADVSVRDVMCAALGRADRFDWAGKAPVRYPLHGGTGAIWTELARRIAPENMRLRARVRRVDAEARIVELTSGEAIRYGHLVSTLPLDILCRMISPALGATASRLRFANAAFVGLGFTGQPPAWLTGVHSFHTPDPDFPCWRMALPANLSPGNAPGPGTWSVLCEISHREGSGFDLDRARDRVLTAMTRRGMIAGKGAVVSTWLHAIEHGYPVPSRDRDAILGTLQPALARSAILSRGRFGGWKYEVSNMDHSFMQGVEAADHLLNAAEERTYARPESIV